MTDNIILLVLGMDEERYSKTDRRDTGEPGRMVHHKKNKREDQRERGNSRGCRHGRDE